MKNLYLITALSSGTQHEIPLEFGGKIPATGEVKKKC